MKLNPITALSDLIGKLVVEHGSAVITEKNLIYLRDQLTAAEKEITRLATDNENLKAKVEYLTAENGQLTKKIQTYEKSAHAAPPNEIETNILLFLARQENTDITPEQISKFLKTNLQIIAFHLEDLRTKRLIEAMPIAPFDHSPKRFWSLAQDGRRYLIKHKLIS